MHIKGLHETKEKVKSNRKTKKKNRSENKSPENRSRISTGQIIIHRNKMYAHLMNGDER